MAKVPASHTNSPEYPLTHRNVYHDRFECRYGQEIKRDGNDIAGDADRPAVRSVQEISLRLRSVDCSRSDCINESLPRRYASMNSNVTLKYATRPLDKQSNRWGSFARIKSRLRNEPDSC